MSVDYEMDDEDALSQIEMDAALDFYGEEDVIQHYDLDTIVSHLDADDLLEAIGEEIAIEHFGLFRKGN